MRVIYDPAKDPRAGFSDRIDAMRAWLEPNGLKPENIVAKYFLVVQADDGSVFVVRREFVRDEDGNKTLDQVILDEPLEDGTRAIPGDGYVKTGWLVTAIPTPPPFTMDGEAA